MKEKLANVWHLLFCLSTLLIHTACSKSSGSRAEPLPPIDRNLPPRTEYVFQNSRDGYSCYRIPAIIKAPNGNLLAFAEGRKNSCDDNGDIDLIVKHSSDNGKSWTALEVLIDNGIYKACNPVPLVDYTDPLYPQGRLFLMYNTITDYIAANGTSRRVVEAWYKTSTNSGSTWSAATNITLQVHRPNAPDYNPVYNFSNSWASSVNAPGHGFQFKRGPYKGRLYVPANHAFTSSVTDYSNYRSFAYFSDDHGTTWQISEDISIPGGNESIAAETSTGNVVQNIRYQNVANIKKRILAFSNTGGKTWQDAYVSDQLVDPICQGSMLDIIHNSSHYLIFSNPAHAEKRENLTIKVSTDEGHNWVKSYQVDKGPAAYSDLVQFSNDSLSVIYEMGNVGGIVVRNLAIDNLLNN